VRILGAQRALGIRAPVLVPWPTHGSLRGTGIALCIRRPGAIHIAAGYNLDAPFWLQENLRWEHRLQNVLLRASKWEEVTAHRVRHQHREYFLARPEEHHVRVEAPVSAVRSLWQRLEEEVGGKSALEGGLRRG